MCSGSGGDHCQADTTLFDDTDFHHYHRAGDFKSNFSPRRYRLGPQNRHRATTAKVGVDQAEGDRCAVEHHGKRVNKYAVDNHQEVDDTKEDTPVSQCAMASL